MTNYDFKVQLRIDTILSKVIATVFRRKNVSVMPGLLKAAIPKKLIQYNLLWPNKTSLDDRIEPIEVTSYSLSSRSRRICTVDASLTTALFCKHLGTPRI